MRTPNRTRHRGWRGGLLLLVLTLSSGNLGCGGSRDVPLEPASGRVTVDGQPAEGVQVRLVPLDRLTNPDTLRPFAATGPDGSFQLGTHRPGEGAPPGRYKVTLTWPDAAPGGSTDRLGGRYGDPSRSTWEVTVPAGSPPWPVFAATRPTRPTSRPGPSRTSRADAAGLD